MALPADLSAARAVSAETPIHDLPSIKVTQVGAAACIDLKCVSLQLVPPENLSGREKIRSRRLSLGLCPTRDVGEEWCSIQRIGSG